MDLQLLKVKYEKEQKVNKRQDTHKSIHFTITCRKWLILDRGDLSQWVTRGITEACLSVSAWTTFSTHSAHHEWVNTRYVSTRSVHAVHLMLADMYTVPMVQSSLASNPQVTSLSASVSYTHSACVDIVSPLSRLGSSQGRDCHQRWLYMMQLCTDWYDCVCVQEQAEEVAKRRADSESLFYSVLQDSILKYAVEF